MPFMDDYFDPMESARNDPLLQDSASLVSPLANYMALSGIEDPDAARRELSKPKISPMSSSERQQSDQVLDQATGVRHHTAEEAQAEAERQGQITWGESLRKVARPLQYVPFAGAYFEDPEAMNLSYDIFRDKGVVPFVDPLTGKEHRDVLQRIEDQNYQDAVEHYRRTEHTSTLSNIGQGVLEIASQSFRLGSEIALARGWAGLGARTVAARQIASAKGLLAPKVAQLTTEAVKAGLHTDARFVGKMAQAKLTRQAVESLAKTDLHTKIAANVGEVLGTSAMRAGIAAPAAALQRAKPTDDELIIDKQGQLMGYESPEAEKGLAHALFKGYASEFVETALEFAGDPIESVVKARVSKMVALPKIKPIVDKLMKRPWIKAGNEAYKKLNAAVLTKMKIHSMPAEYAEERIQGFARALFNLDRGNEKTPLANRLLEVARFEVDNPAEALSMILGFSLMPLGQRAVGMAKGALSPTDVEANAVLSDEIGVMFKSPEVENSLVSKMTLGIANDPHVQTRLQQMWNATVNLVGRKSAKVNLNQGLLKSSQPPAGSLGDIVRTVTDIEDYKSFQEEIQTLVKSGTVKDLAAAEARVRTVLRRGVGYHVIRATANSQTPVPDQLSPDNVNALLDLGNMTSDEVESTLTSVNAMVEKGKIRFADIGFHSVLYTHEGQRRPTISAADLAAVEDPKLKYFIQSHVTEVTTPAADGTPVLNPMISMPTADWRKNAAGKSPENRGKWIKVLGRIAAMSEGSASLGTLIAQIDKMVTDKSGIVTINFAPAALAQLQKDKPLVPVYGSQADKAGKKMTLTAEARGPSTTEEGFHAESRRRGSMGKALDTLSRLQAAVKEMEPEDIPDKLKAQVAAIDEVKDLGQANEILTKLAVYASGAYTGEAQWHRAPDSRTARAMNILLRSSPEGVKVLRDLVKAHVGEAAYKRMKMPAAEDIFAEAVPVTGIPRDLGSVAVKPVPVAKIERSAKEELDAKVAAAQAPAAKAEKRTEVKVLPDWQNLTTYHGLPVSYDKLSKTGSQIGARYLINKKAIVIDKTGGMQAMWERYQKGASAYRLPVKSVGTFASLDEFAAFILEHEYQHSLFPQRVAEALVDYENRINDAAIKALGRVVEIPAAKVPSQDPGVILGTGVSAESLDDSDMVEIDLRDQPFSTGPQGESVDEFGNYYQSAQSEATRMNHFIRDVLKLAGFEGQDQQMPHIRQLTLNPAFQKIRSIEDLQAFFATESPFPASSPLTTVFNKLKGVRETFTQRDMNTLLRLGQTILVDSRQMYTDQKGNTDTQRRPLSAHVASIDRQIVKMIPVVLKKAIDKRLDASREIGLASDPYSVRGDVVDLMRRQLLAAKTPNEIAAWCADLTGIAADRWLGLKVATTGVMRGRHRLFGLQRAFLTELGSDAPAKGKPGILAELRKAQYSSTPEAMTSMIVSRLSDMFTGQSRTVQGIAEVVRDRETNTEAQKKADLAASVFFSPSRMLADFSETPEYEQSVRVQSPSGRAMPMLSLPSHLLLALKDYGRPFFRMLGLYNASPRVALDASDMSNADLLVYRFADFKHSLGDPEATTYAQWIGQMGGKVSAPSIFVEMPLYRFDTAESKAAVTAAFARYQKEYTRVYSVKAETAIALFVPPSELKSLSELAAQGDADSAFRFNNAVNMSEVMQAIHGDLTQYGSAKNIVKRAGTLSTPGSEPLLGIKGGVKPITKTLIIKDPRLHPVYGLDSEGTMMKGKLDGVEGSDGAVFAFLDWMRRYTVSTDGDLTDRPDGFSTTKAVYSATDAKGLRTLFKCSILREDLGSAFEDSYHKLLIDHVRSLGLDVDQIVFGSAAKVSGVGAPIDIIKGSEGKWTLGRSISQADVVDVETKSWRWVMDSTSPLEKVSDNVPKQFLMAWSTFPEFDEATELMLEGQAEELTQFANQSYSAVMKEVVDIAVDEMPSLKDVVDGTRSIDNLTVLEKLELKPHAARYLSKQFRNKWPAFSSTVNVPSGGSKGLSTSRRMSLNTKTGKYVEDPNGDRVRVSRILINVNSAMGNDEITPGFVKGRERARGRLLGEHARHPLKNDLFYSRKTEAECYHAFAKAMALEDLGDLREDMFRLNQDQNRDQLAKALAEVSPTDLSAVLQAIDPFIQVEELEIVGRGDRYEVHIPGELAIYERVPTGGPDTIGVGRLTKFLPGSGNITMLSTEDWTRTGSDFDIDKWYNLHWPTMYRKDSESALRSKTRARRVLQIANNTFKNPKTLYRFMSPVDTSKYDNVGTMDQQQFPMNHTQNDERDIQLVGQRSLGFAAVLGRIMSTLDRVGIFIKDREVDISPEKTIKKKPQFKLWGLDIDMTEEARKPGPDRKTAAIIQQDHSFILNQAADLSKLGGQLELQFGVNEITMAIQRLAFSGSELSKDPKNILKLRRAIAAGLKSPKIRKLVAEARGDKTFETIKFTRMGGGPGSDQGPADDQKQEWPGNHIWLKLWAKELSKIQRVINSQFSLPESRADYQYLVEVLGSIEQNELPRWDVSRLPYAPEFRIAKLALNIAGDKLYTEGDVDATEVAEKIMRVPQGLTAEERSREIKARSFELKRGFIRQTLMQIDPDLKTVLPSSIPQELSLWQNAYPDNTVLQALEMGRIRGTSDIIMRVRDFVKNLEPKTPERDALREDWDKLPTEVTDKLAWYSNEHTGPDWHNRRDSLYNMWGPKYLLRLNEFAQEVVEDWAKGRDLVELRQHWAAVTEAPVAQAAKAPVTADSDVVKEQQDLDQQNTVDEEFIQTLPKDTTTATVLSTGPQYQAIETTIKAMPGLSNKMHRLFLDLSNKQKGKDSLIYQEMRAARMLLGFQEATPGSKKSKLAYRMLNAITVVLDQYELVTNVSDTDLKDNPELFTWTGREVQRDTQGQIRMEIQNVKGIGPTGVVLFNATGKEQVSDIIAEYEAARKKDSSLKPWREVAGIARKTLDRMLKDADPRLDIVRRERYAPRKWRDYESVAVDIESMDVAFNAYFRKAHEKLIKGIIKSEKDVPSQWLSKYRQDRAEFRKNTLRRQQEQSRKAIGPGFGQSAITLESERAKERELWRLADGAKYGYIPKTLDISELIQDWQANTGAAETNIIYLNALAVAKEVRASEKFPSMPQAVFLLDKAARVKGKMPIDVEAAYEHLENFLEMVKALPFTSKNVLGVEVDRLRDPWEQMQEIFDKASMEDQMLGLGFQQLKLPVNRLGFTRAWVQGGAPYKLVQHLASRGYRDLAERPGGWGVAGNILLGINKINAFAKQLQLGLSFFHHFAQMESYIAGFGGAPLNPLRIPAMIRGWKKALKDLHSGAALPWAKAGMEIATKKLGPDTPEDSLGKTLKLLENVAGKYFLTKPLGQIPKALGVMHKLNNYFLWDVLQPGLKIQLADHLLAEAMAERPGIDENGLRRDISNVVNDLFGGQNFAEYLWATPMVRDVMRSMWLAPDWTISAINTARLGEMLGGIFQTHSAVLNKATSTDVTQKFLANRYWPTFIFVLLLGIPNLLQMLIWLFEQKKENPDPNLKPLAVLNEKDKQAHVDVTPLFKAMGFDKFPDRRVYIRYGKQAYELGRWFTGTFTAALTKGSPVLKTAWEQITNKSTMGWDMPWVRNADFSNTATGFWDTRAAALSKQFIPLTALGMLDGRPVTPFTAASLGMSQFKATKDLKMIFSMYVENTFWDQIKGSPPRVQKMQDLVPRIVDGLVANGYGDHVKRIMSNAVNSVARRYNFEIANELQKNPDDPNIGKIAAVMKKLTRLDKTVSNINKSLDQTMKYGLKKYTREQRQAQHKAIRDAWKKTMETRPRD